MKERIEFVMKAMQTLNFRALCQEYGVSPKTGYKWKERFLERGMAGMEEESRRPKSNSERLGQEEVCEMVALKLAHPNWGPRKIRELYKRRHGGAASESSFKRVLEDAGLTQKRKRRRCSQAGRLSSGRQAQAVNEVWTVDFKGWWRNRQGGRCEPLTVRDEYSRYLLEVRDLANARSETVRESFERLFHRQGLPEAIRSDNGSPFACSKALLGLSRLSVWWVALGIDLERGRPGHPQDNGGHERVHRDISREIEALGVSDQAALDVWRESFNCERPHESLAMHTPGEVYVPSKRKYEGTPEDLDYPQMCPRRVSRCGMIKVNREYIFLSTALGGWSVGLKPSATDRMEVWFGSLLLGEADLAASSFIQADPRFEKMQKSGGDQPE